MITRNESVLSKQGGTDVKRYVEENGVLLAEGEGYLRAYEDYLVNHLNYDLTDESIQVWATIEDFPNYEVSTLGLVRNKNSGVVLTPTTKIDGNCNLKANWRFRVKLTNGDITVNRKIHHLVIKAFLGDCPGYVKNEKGEYIVSHENDRPFDNRLINLKYRTQQENKDIEGLNRDLRSGWLTVHNRDYVYDYILEILSDKQIDVNKISVEDLEDTEIVEVRKATGLTKGTIKAMYEMCVHARGMLARLGVDEYGRYYRLTDKQYGSPERDTKMEFGVF